MPIKFRLFRGWGYFVFFLGGGECRFYFHGREDFSDKSRCDFSPALENRNRRTIATLGGRRTEQVKTGQVNLDHLRTFRGSFRGSP